VFIESALKADAIGVNMNKKIKRIGCSNIKDLIEQNKLTVVDADTILELSTFVAMGTSYEASPGNHDDLMMNLVLFGWFATTPFFINETDIDIKTLMFAEHQKMIEDDLVPFGFTDDGLDHHEEEGAFTSGGDVWSTAWVSDKY
jgi:hypothetical protein